MSFVKNDCIYAGIAPQALGQSGPNSASIPYTYSAFDGERVNFTQVNEPMHRIYKFPDDGQKWGRAQSSMALYPGLYNSGLVCNRGISGIDNVCVCPGSADQMPFQYEVPQMSEAITNLLFSPFLPNAIPQLTPAAQQLVAERSRLPRSAGAYYNLDAPLPSCSK